MKKDTIIPAAFFRALVIVLGLLMLSQCSFVPSLGFPVTVYSPAITLEWDPPWTLVAENFTDIVGYNVYCKPHFGNGWRRLITVPIEDAPQAVIQFEDVGAGAWDFAVTTMDSGGQESAFHTSIDATARPVGGWYILWNR